MKQILVLLFLILPLCGQAQSDNYHGIVIDKEKYYCPLNFLWKIQI